MATLPTLPARTAFARARRHLDQELFLDAPPRRRITARRALTVLSIAVAATAVQLLRVWSSLPLESLWSEDGGIWLGGALTRDPLDALTTTHNGYLQTASRLVAEPVAALPVEWYPATMSIAGAAIVTGCAFVVWRASAAHIENAFLRATLAAMVILLGVAGTETLANVTNSIWFLLFACFWLLLWRPSSFPAAAGAAALAFLIAVTTVGSVFLAPLCLLRLIAVRDRRDGVIVAAFALGLAVQLGFSWNELGPGDDAGNDAFNTIPAGQPFSSQPYWDWELVPAFTQRIVGGAAAGQPLNAYLWERLGAPFAIALGIGAVALVGSALANRRTCILVPLSVGIALALFLASGYQRWGSGGALLFWSEGVSNDLGARFLVTPSLLMLSAFFVCLDAGPRGAAASERKRARWPVVQAGATAFVVICALASFSVGNRTVRGSLPWSDALAAGRAECRDPGVAGVMVQIGKPPFSGFPVPLSCAKLE